MVVFIARRERAAVHDGRCCALPCSRNLQQQPATTVDAAAICCCCCCLQQKRLWSRVATRTGMKSAKLQRETRYIATRVAGVRGCFFFCCVSMHARERERPFLLLRQQTNRSHTHTPFGAVVQLNRQTVSIPIHTLRTFPSPCHLFMFFRFLSPTPAHARVVSAVCGWCQHLFFTLNELQLSNALLSQHTPLTDAFLSLLFHIYYRFAVLKTPEHPSLNNGPSSL